MSDDSKSKYIIDIKIETEYLSAQSNPEKQEHTFAYTIKIKNQCSQKIQILSRYWKITDSDNKIQEVRGDGVVGKQPVLQPDEEFTYTSGVLLPTSVGSMEGYYKMQAADGVHFKATIPAFSLAIPNVIH